MGNTNRPQLVVADSVLYKGTGTGGIAVQCSSGEQTIDAVTYVYLLNTRDTASYIASFKVPAYTRTKQFKFGEDLLEEGQSYYVVWATCSCARKTNIAQSTPVEVTSMLAWQREQDRRDAEVARQREQERLERERKARELEREAHGSRYYWHLSEEERDVLRRQFDEADIDGNKTISRAELKAYYDKKLHEKLYDSEIDEMINEADIGMPDGRIQFGEFVDICCLAKARETSVKWQNLYRQFASEMAHANKRARI